MHGFRFSITDAIVLVIAGATTLELSRRDNALTWLPAVVVCHFFLFCNVFRLRRNYELFWALFFLLNVGFWMSRLSLEAWPPLLTQLPVTVALLMAEIRSPNYHGILARKYNPRLAEYLAARKRTPV